MASARLLRARNSSRTVGAVTGDCGCCRVWGANHLRRGRALSAGGAAVVEVILASAAIFRSCSVISRNCGGGAFSIPLISEPAPRSLEMWVFGDAAFGDAAFGDAAF